MQSTIQPTKQDNEKSSGGEGWSLKPMGKGTKFERGREPGKYAYRFKKCKIWFLNF